MMQATVEVSDIDLAFPAHVVGVLIPRWEDLPQEYKRHPYAQLAESWFYGRCGNKQVNMEPREGIDQEKALRMIRAVMGSFEPRHEHKMAGIAYLIDSFFSKFEILQ